MSVTDRMRHITDDGEAQPDAPIPALSNDRVRPACLAVGLEHQRPRLLRPVIA
jgi:hypothetical protein